MGDVIHIGFVAGKGRRISPPERRPKAVRKRVATVGDAMAVYFAKVHPGSCSPANHCGPHCYTLAAARELKINTIRGYGSALRVFGPILDELGEVTTESVNRWRQDIHGPPYGRSRAHANYCLRVLKLVTQAVRDHKQTRAFDRLAAACLRATAFKQGEKLPREPPPDVVARCLPVCRNYAEECWIVLIARTGLRRDEMLGLRPEHYRADRGQLHVMGQRGDPESRKLRENDHIIDLGADSCARIEWLIRHNRKIGAKHGHPLRVSGYLFPWGRTYLENFMARLRAHLGDDARLYFPHRTAWHAFRHFGAGQVVAQHEGRADGAAAVKKFLGHATDNAAMTYMSLGRAPSRTREVDVDVESNPG